MQETKPVTIRMFGTLYTLRKERGLRTSIEMSMPVNGRKALEIAMDLNLPLATIGCIYCNHRTYDLHHVICPGDRVAFVPKSVPGPHMCLQNFTRLRGNEESGAEIIAAKASLAAVANPSFV